MELTQTEVDRFWKMGCPLEAMFVPQDELERAFKEGRIQWAYSFSSMGTGDLGWKHPSEVPTKLLHDYAIVPPGQHGESWPYEHMLDERNTEVWLWRPFRAVQDTVIAGSVDGTALVDTILTYLLGAPAAQSQSVLCDWMISGDSIDPEFIRSELATTYAEAPEFLRVAVRARWLTNSTVELLGAISTLEIQDYPYTAGRIRRMAFLHRVIF